MIVFSLSYLYYSMLVFVSLPVHMWTWVFTTAAANISFLPHFKFWIIEYYRYYHNITSNTLVVLEAMASHNVKTLIYSSTCATYGEPEKMPITEETPQVNLTTFYAPHITKLWFIFVYEIVKVLILWLGMQHPTYLELYDWLNKLACSVTCADSNKSLWKSQKDGRRYYFGFP